MARYIAVRPVFDPTKWAIVDTKLNQILEAEDGKIFGTQDEAETAVKFLNEGDEAK